jgi:GDPmannose 4,6-dehydratase
LEKAQAASICHGEFVARIAIVTGIGGQDGYYLSELLRSKGYEVFGVELPGKFVAPGLCSRLFAADVGTQNDLGGILDAVRPDEVYNLAGLSRVSDSFEQPVAFASANGVGPVRLLEAIRRYRDRTSRDVRFYQASTSEMFGSAGPLPQRETSPYHPRSPYACSKVFAHLQTINYREAFGLFACCGILFNHESPRRPEHFVTRKITAAAARIKRGETEPLRLGNIDVRRDWGFAGDYVEAMWRMLQQATPDDFVIATGQTHSVREFGEAVFSYLGIDWSRHAVVDPLLYRPADIENVCGDASKARRVLGWQPRVTFGELVRMMADHDVERFRQEQQQQQ